MEKLAYVGHLLWVYATDCFLDQLFYIIPQQSYEVDIMIIPISQIRQTKASQLLVIK